MLFYLVINIDFDPDIVEFYQQEEGCPDLLAR